MGELEEGHFEGDGHMHEVDNEGAETHFTRPPIPGSESRQLELTEDEKSDIERIAEENGISEGQAELLYRNRDL